MQDGYPFVNRWTKEDLCNNGKKLLKMYPKYSKKVLDNKVTGDETWVYYFEPKQKCSNQIWATKKKKVLPNEYEWWWRFCM